MGKNASFFSKLTVDYVNNNYGGGLNTCRADAAESRLAYSLFCQSLRNIKRPSFMFALYVSSVSMVIAAEIPTLPAKPPAETCSPIQREEGGVLSPTQLSSANIGSIVLVKQPIFDPTNPAENKTFHQLTNQFNITTRDKTLLRQLPFQVGDRYRPTMLEEAERVLRRNTYLTEVKIEPIEICGDEVSIVVTTKEVWSILPSASYRQVDDESTIVLSLTDVNFFGRGETLTVGYISEEDQTSVNAGFFAPYLIADTIDLSLGFASGDQLSSRRVSLTKPFRNFDTHYSYGLELSELEVEPSRYLRGDAFYAYDQTTQRATLFWGHSKGLQKGRVKRWRYGVTYDKRKFSNFVPLPFFDQIVGPNPQIGPIQNRDRQSIWLSYQHFSDQYRKMKNIRHMHRTEDIFLGTNWQWRLGIVDDAEFHDTDYLNLWWSLRSSPLATERHLLQTFFTVDTHWGESNVRENLIAILGMRYYWLHSEKRRTYLLAQRTAGRSLTIDRLFTQGGNAGLRGYPEFYQIGNEQYRVNLEHRFYHDWTFMQFLQFASAIYVDAGRAWLTEPTPGFTQYKDDGHLWNVGLGLRISSNKVGQGSIAHIDIAFPMEEAPELTANEIGEDPKGARFTIEILRSF